MSLIKETVCEKFEENNYTVHKIHKKSKTDLRFLVEWKGFPDEHDYTWESHQNLKNCDVYQEYNKKSNKRKREDRGIIVRDIFKKTKRGALTNDERLDLVREQDYKCNLCLNPFGSSSFEVDHIIPLEQGGTNDMVNLQGLCNNCHIFKTSVLDRGVIARLLQAKLHNDNIKISRTDILIECQIFYFNRNKNRRPFQEDEMLNFCITAADIYREMCKKEIKKRFLCINIMESKIKLDINTVDEETKEILPPEPRQSLDNPSGEQTEKVDKKSKYLNGIVSMIKQVLSLGIENNLITLKTFTLKISVDKNTAVDIDELGDKLYSELNIFFRKIHDNAPSEMTICIGPVTILYTRVNNQC